MQRFGGETATIGLLDVARDLDAINAHCEQTSDQETIDAPVGFAEIAGIVQWCGNGVGDLSVVQNGAATRRPPHDVDILPAEA
jgi:hypothetical protein